MIPHKFPHFRSGRGSGCLQRISRCARNDKLEKPWKKSKLGHYLILISMEQC